MLNVALLVIQELTAESPRSDAEKAFQKAQTRMGANDTAGARRLFNRSLVKQPDHAGALGGLLSLGKTDDSIRLEALARLQRGLAAAPTSEQLHHLATENGLFHLPTDKGEMRLKRRQRSPAAASPR